MRTNSTATRSRVSSTVSSRCTAISSSIRSKVHIARAQDHILSRAITAVIPGRTPPQQASITTNRATVSRMLLTSLRAQVPVSMISVRLRRKLCRVSRDRARVLSTPTEIIRSSTSTDSPSRLSTLTTVSSSTALSSISTIRSTATVSIRRRRTTMLKCVRRCPVPL